MKDTYKRNPVVRDLSCKDNISDVKEEEHAVICMIEFVIYNNSENSRQICSNQPTEEQKNTLINIFPWGMADA